MKKLWLALKINAITMMNSVYSTWVDGGLTSRVFVVCFVLCAPLIQVVYLIKRSVGSLGTSTQDYWLSAALVIPFLSCVVAISFPLGLFFEYLREIKPEDVPELEWRKKK